MLPKQLKQSGTSQQYLHVYQPWLGSSRSVSYSSDRLHAPARQCTLVERRFLIMQESNVRRGKVLAAADQYAQLINGAIETIVEQSFSSKHLAKSTDSSSQPVVRHIPLPPSIIANTEPFRHGDWRKEPYPTRSTNSLGSHSLCRCSKGCWFAV